MTRPTVTASARRRLMLVPLLAVVAQPLLGVLPSAAAAPAAPAALTRMATTFTASPASPAPAPAAPTAWRTRVASGSSRAVVTHDGTWQGDRFFVGGRAVTVAGGKGTSPLLRRGRAGDVTYRVPVPAPGRYSVRMVLSSAGKSTATVDLVADRRVVRRGVKLPSTRTKVLSAAAVSALTVTWAATTTTRSLDLRVVPRSTTSPVVSGVEVTRAPARAAALPDGGVGAGGAAAVTPVIPARAAATPQAGPTGLPAAPAGSWVSGAYPGRSIDGPAANAFGAWRGRPLDVAVVFHTRDTWDKIANERWSESVYANFPGRLAVSLPFLPSNLDAKELPRVAAGDFDAYYAAFARGLVASGRGNSIVRLSWEFNGNWFSWAAFDAVTWKASFRRVVGIMKAQAPDLLIDWNGNIGPSQVGHDPFTALYPGDDVVDIIGLDAYDNAWGRVVDAASWQHFRLQDGGLDRWYAFAQSRGKKMSVPEWGLDKAGGGDNPYFIQSMHDWFAGHASGLAYEAYFNEPYDYIASALDGPEQQNPRSAALYAKLWGNRN